MCNHVISMWSNWGQFSAKPESLNYSIRYGIKDVVY